MEPYPLSGASCVILVVVAFLARLLDDYTLLFCKERFRVFGRSSLYIFFIPTLLKSATRTFFSFLIKI